MKTLWQKLKPEIKQAIKDQQDKYPSMVEGVKISLKENYFWSHLTIGQARDIVSFTDTPLHSISYEDWAFGAKFLIHED